MTAADDQIPCVETYKGVGIHDGQGPERIALVKREIDAVITISDADLLMEVAGDVTWAPESRLLAAARLKAMHAIATEDRTVRPAFDLAYVGALVPGLASNRCRDPDAYRSIFDHETPPGQPDAVKRDKPLDR